MVAGVVCWRSLLLRAKHLQTDFLLIFARIAHIVSVIFAKRELLENNSKKITKRTLKRTTKRTKKRREKNKTNI